MLPGITNRNGQSKTLKQVAKTNDQIAAYFGLLSAPSFTNKNQQTNAISIVAQVHSGRMLR